MRKIVSFLALVCFLCVGCLPAYRREFRDMAQIKGWTEEQTEAAHAYSYRLFFLVEDEQSPGQFTLNQRVLAKERWLERTKGFIDLINETLSYENPYEDWRYADHYGVREPLERLEKVWEVKYSRVMTAHLHDKFRELTGDTAYTLCDCGSGSGGYQSNDYYSSNEGAGYDYSGADGYHDPYEEQKKLAKGFDWKSFSPQPISDIYKFEIAKIDSAAKDGSLKPVEESNIFVSRKYDKQVPDLANLDDPNKFKWVPKTVSLEMEFYKIIPQTNGHKSPDDDPNDNKSDYALAYRSVTEVVDGKKVTKRETQPCLKAFMVNGGVVVVIDIQKEGEPGFGAPDIVEKVSNLGKSSDVYRDDRLLALMFDNNLDRERVRQKPQDKELFVKVNHVTPVDVWEEAPDKQNGWPLPDEYKNQLQTNFNVKFEWEKRRPDGQLSLFRKLEWVVKEWTANGNRHEVGDQAVVERHKPKPPYDQELTNARVLYQENSRKVSFVFRDGGEETSVVMPGPSKFFEDRPLLVSFNNGERRFELKWDEETKTYRWRREVSAVDLKTGVYTD